MRVFSNGNMEIMGQKKLHLNNGNEYVRLSGMIRPQDISANNVVQSSRIANAKNSLSWCWRYSRYWTKRLVKSSIIEYFTTLNTRGT